MTDWMYGELWPRNPDEECATVCKAHKRFIPCRGDEAECQWSSEPGDVAMVRAYQGEKE